MQKYLKSARAIYIIRFCNFPSQIWRTAICENIGSRRNYDSFSAYGCQHRSKFDINRLVRHSSSDSTYVTFQIQYIPRSKHMAHDDVMKWKHFPRYWPFVRGIHWSPVNSPHKGQWRGALMFSLICVWINGWANNREAGDLRRYRAHHDVSVMLWFAVFCCGLLPSHFTHILQHYLVVLLGASEANDG